MSEQQVQTELDDTQSTEAEEAQQGEESQAVEETQSLPPGYKTEEQYIADGGDPAEYKGPKAYSREHDRIVENRNLQRQLKEMTRNMTTVMQQQKEQLQHSIADQNAQKDQKIAQLTADLMQAHDDMDTKKTEQITKQITKIESAKVDPVIEQNQPVQFSAALEALGEFVQDNDILNPESASFDEELENAVEVQLRGQFNSSMKPGKAIKLFEKALSDAKKAIPRFNQKEPKKASSTRQPGTKGVQKGKASVNSLPPESRQMYDHLLKNMGTEKLGKAAAEDYLKSWSLDNG